MIRILVIFVKDLKMAIEYKKMSLFDAPKYSIITHACNAQGIWGSGIAKEFKHRYSYSYEEYKKHCESKDIKTGSSGLAKSLSSLVNETHTISWIITSENYGDKVDSECAILANTALAVKDLCENIINWHKISTFNFKPDKKIDIYSNKFNSGLFKVPWKKTEIVLQEVLKHYPSINWIVCSQ